MDRVGKLEHTVNGHDKLCAINKCHTIFSLDINPDMVTVQINITENTPYVFLFISCAKKKAKFLIDSGASASFISANLIKTGTRINRKNIVNVKSATGHSAKTIATLITEINFNNHHLAHEFHIFGRDLQIAVDGIIGFDFIYKHNWIIFPHLKQIVYDPALIAFLQSAILEFENKIKIENTAQAAQNTIGNMCKTLNTNKINEFDFPEKTFELKINKFSFFPPSNTDLHDDIIHDGILSIHKVAPENELKCFRFETDLINGDFFIDHKEVLPNVYTIPAIIRVTNKLAMLPIYNKNNFPVLLPNKKPNENFFKIASNFNVYHLNETKVDRNKYIMDNITIGQCSEYIKQIIKKLCIKFNDCFFVDGDKISHTDIISHSINLKPDATSVYVKQYRIPESQKLELQKQIAKMEQQGIIEKCLATGWNSPVILVPKKDANGEKTDFRLVVDYRKLNEALIPIHFPIPQIHSIIDRLGKCKFFSCLDLHGAFYQIKLEQNSKKFTTFENNSFSYQFISMPQGLQTSPAVMQNAVNLLFQDSLNKGVNIYLDDIIIYSKTFEEHTVLLENVFEKLRLHNFQLKITKCQFLMKEIQYLGFVINENGCLPNQKKIECIVKYPKPNCVADIQRFLGLCNYFSHYIANYAKLAKPLYNLLKKNIDFDWNSVCNAAFEQLKAMLVTAPILIFPDFELIFIVTTDASDFSVGCMLSQGDIPKDKPIAFASKALNSAQQNYSTIEKELYAILFAVDAFRHYIYGFEFILFTDHKPLVYLYNLKNPSSRLYRWKLQLAEYRFKIVYKKGSHNTVADALSRIKNLETEIIDIQPLICNSSEQLAAITRSKSRQISETIQQQHNNISDRKKSHVFYDIIENNDILSDTGNIDHSFYFFNKIDCEMKKKLEYRIKKNIELPTDCIPLTPYIISDSMSIIIFPNESNSDIRISNTKIIFNLILGICNDSNFKEIALNMDIRDTKTYFEFKYLFKEIFKLSHVKTTFYLNKIIEVYQLDEILDILNTYHYSSLAGHASYEKTKNSIKRYYRWPTMNIDIKNFLKNCEICKKSKISRHTRSPLQITSTAKYPFEKVYIDYVNIEREHTTEFPCIFTCIDELTKYAIAVATHNSTALTTAQTFVTHVILKYNIPEYVVSDQGSTFLSDVFKEITKLFKIKKITTTAYRPNSNIVERFHRTLGQHLTTCVHANPSSWHEHLDAAVFAYNNTINSATGYSPHELLFGYAVQLPDKIIRNNSPIYNYESYKENLRANLSKFWKLARENIAIRKEKNKNYHDKSLNPISLKIGDKVFVKKPFKKHKYATPYDGPFVVDEILSQVTVKIKKGNKLIKIHTDKLKMA